MSRRLCPALGDLWSHCITNRIMMDWHSANISPTTENSDRLPHRRASLVKSPTMPPAHALFRVIEKGFRDVEEVCKIIE